MKILSINEMFAFLDGSFICHVFEVKVLSMEKLMDDFFIHGWKVLIKTMDDAHGRSHSLWMALTFLNSLLSVVLGLHQKTSHAPSKGPSLRWRLSTKKWKVWCMGWKMKWKINYPSYIHTRPSGLETILSK